MLDGDGGIRSVCQACWCVEWGPRYGAKRVKIVEILILRIWLRASEGVSM